jgi:hypothetical protein
MMLETFGQFAFLLFLFPPSIIIIFPSLLEKLLSNGLAMYTGAHYSAAITAVTVIATFEAIPRIYRYKFINKFIKDTNIFFTVLIFYMAFSASIIYGYVGFSPLLLVQPNPFEKGLTSDNSQLLSQILSQLPPNTTVSAEYQIVLHSNEYYKDVTVWPGMTGTEDYVIIDTELYPLLGATTQDYTNALIKLSKNKNYQLIIANYGIFVFKKRSFSP